MGFEVLKSLKGLKPNEIGHPDNIFHRGSRIVEYIRSSRVHVVGELAYRANGRSVAPRGD
jgi:hypothetical protein